MTTEPEAPRARTRLTRQGAIALGVAAVAFGLARWQGSRTLALLVWAVALGVVVAVLSSSRKLSVRIDRSEVPRRLREGEPIEVTLLVSAERRTPAVRIADTLPDALGSAQALTVAGLVPGTEVAHAYRLAPRRRGAYVLGPATVTAVDSLGLSERIESLAGTVEVLVHPRTEPVVDRVLARRWEDAPLRPPVSKPWPTGLDLYGMRDYVPGDDLRRVVWSAVARTGRMLVREAEQGITDQCTVIVDVDPSRHRRGADDVDTFEPAIRAAASLGDWALREQMSVSLVLGDRLVLDRTRGASSRVRILDALAKAEAFAAPLTIVRPGSSVLPGAGQHLAVIATRLTEADAGALRVSVDRGASVTFVAITGEELDPATVTRAAAAGCEVVRLTVGAPLAEVFAHHVGATRDGSR